MSHLKVKYESYKGDQFLFSSLFSFGLRAGCVLCDAMSRLPVIATQGDSELSQK